MKKLLLIFFCFLSFATISHAEDCNLKGLKHLFALLEKDITAGDSTYASSFEYINKNSVNLKADVIQVIEDTDTTSLFLAHVYEGEKMKSLTAMIQTVDEIVYDGKEFENLRCFLVGTFTYSNKLNEEKTVPLYFTLDQLLNFILKKITQ